MFFRARYGEKLIFALHVVSAFFIGGGLITVLSVIAEKSPRSWRGIVISFPSTMAVSFVFIALSFSPSRISSHLPGVYYSLIGAILFAFSFAVVAQIFKDRTPEQKWPVVLTLIIATGLWLLVPAVSLYLPHTLFFSLSSLLLAILILQPLMTHYAGQFPVNESGPQLTSAGDLLFRALFSGSIIVAALICARFLGPFWGAVVGGTYPAAFGSQLMLFQSKYRSDVLPSLVTTVPTGVLSTTAYATTVAVTYPKTGIFNGTIIAILVGLAVSILAGLISHRKS